MHDEFSEDPLTNADVGDLLESMRLRERGGRPLAEKSGHGGYTDGRRWIRSGSKRSPLEFERLQLDLFVRSCSPDNTENGFCQD
jgi:hypothetical protein